MKSARRARAGENGELRLDCWLSAGAVFALRRLAKAKGQTRRQLLESLLLTADQQHMDTLTDEELESYLDVTR